MIPGDVLTIADVGGKPIITGFHPMIAIREDEKGHQNSASIYLAGELWGFLVGEIAISGGYRSEKSKQNYPRLIVEYIASDGLFLSKADKETLSISSLAEAYLRHAKKEFGGDRLSRKKLLRTVYGDALLGCRALTFVYGPTLANEFGPQSLKAIREDLLIHHKHGTRKDGQPNRRLTRPVVNRRIRAIARIFKWAVAESLVRRAKTQSWLSF